MRGQVSHKARKEKGTFRGWDDTIGDFAVVRNVFRDCSGKI